MEIEKYYFIASGAILLSLLMTIWMVYVSHTRNREIVIQRDQIHELEVQKLELEKLKSIASAEEEQMRRIGRYLHDEVGGNLHVLLHLLSNPNTSTESISEESLNKAVELTRKSIDSVRMTSQELVPYFLINFGLSKTIQSIVDDANDIPGLKVQFTKSIQWPIEDLPQDLTIQLYRLLQEVYSNLLRHAKPTEIQINLSTSDAGMQLLLTHNGVGLSQSEFEHLSKTAKSLGLQNIAYRKKLIKASVTYQRTTTLSTIEIKIARQDLSFA